MDYQRQANDTVTVHPNVLRSIIRSAAGRVAGVAPLDRSKIRLQVSGEEISVEVGLVVEASQDLQKVSRQVQAEISRMLQEYVGLAVRAVNVHIEDLYG